jgi:hypothetical protein
MKRVLFLAIALAGFVACAQSESRVDPAPEDSGLPVVDASRAESGPVDAGYLPDVTGCNPAQLTTDPFNCGKCNNVCKFDNSEGLCQSGQCAMGKCQPGFLDINKNPVDGCEYACWPTPNPAEICDGLDNDCNGKVDDGIDTTSDINHCGSCLVACQFANGQPSCVNGKCSLATCQSGYRDLNLQAGDGCEYKCPVFPTRAETCNGVDDDCNGIIDDNPNDVGQACDTSCPAQAGCVATNTCAYARSTCTGRCCGVCTGGTTVCASGQKVCTGGAGPRIETCNGVDDNCDGQIDEGFDTKTDPLNCGGCGIRCSLTNAVAGCSNGQCTIVACRPGYNNVDSNEANGCEYTCPVNPPTAEACNGKDDDCDGTPDDNLTVPQNVCIQTSICAGAVPTCGGSKGWVCNYQQVNANIQVDANGNLAIAETLCDGIDNNCNGQIDESFPQKGQPCFAGTGACQGQSTFACTANKLSTFCPASASPTAAVDETCNGIDDNCDGQIDERTPRPGFTCYNGAQHACRGWSDPMVQVGNVWFYAYEASRPDATGTAAGSNTSRACSKSGTLPWASVNWTEAAAACDAVKDSQGQSMRLCSEPEWANACNLGNASTPIWSFSTNPTTYSTTTCNGADNNLLKAWLTGSGASCYANQTNGRIFDMSGNVGEWTNTPVTVNGRTYYNVRGGSFNSNGYGTNCNFDFTIGLPTYRFSDLGFRCCSVNAP